MKILLSKRLKMVASMVTGDSIADVGCDHGKLGAYLYQNGKINKVINMDISKASLDKAEELMSQFKGCQSASRVSDGCDALGNQEVDTLVMAGLGGTEMAIILERAFGENKKYNRYVLSPNRHPEKVRQVLLNNGYGIKEDVMLKEGGIYYVVFSAERDGKIPIDNEIYYGINFRTDPVFREYCINRIEHLNNLLLTHSNAEGVKTNLKRLNSAKKELIND